MKVDVKLSFDEKFVENSQKGIASSKVAAGWVEIEECFKFPIQIFNNSKENKMFVSYPSVMKDDGKNNILFPVDLEVRKEVEEKIFQELQHMITKGMHTPPITDIRINFLKENTQRGSIAIKAMASIKICGFVINGIAVKESSKGLFVQMPQYATGEGKNMQYHDTVYGTTSFSQGAIKNAVLDAYEKEREKEIRKETVEPVQKPVKEDKKVAGPML